MRRYRKGQMWRPPTAAESAARADATEGFRRRPAQPQDLVPQGQGLWVKTPEGGIAGRSGTTIYSAVCTKCIEVPTGTGSQKSLTETDEEILVYNLDLGPVAGSVYVRTDLTPYGTRYAEPFPLQFLQLAEDHPGRGTAFNVWLASWDPATDGPGTYDKSTTYKAIDWRYGVPEPAKCATGDGFWYPSDTHGKIIYVNSLDCLTPGCAGSS